MAIRDYWIFQKRDALKPWAFLVVKEYDKRVGKTATTLDYTFYHEDIENPEHQISELCLYYENSSEYADHFCSVIAEYSPVTSQDRIQLIQEITKILLD